MLSIVLFVELMAIVVSLLIYEDRFLEKLGGISVYLQWCFLGSVALICLCRNAIQKMSYRNGVLSLVAICLATFLSVEVFFQWALQGFQSFALDYVRLIIYLCIAVIMVLVSLWLMTFSERIERSSRAQAQAKVQALQSRIRPHFLFNSLNSIAELAATDPENAESAIASLSLLFRASMENVERSHSLKSELELCDRYIELERWRLGNKLDYSTEIQIDQTSSWQVPKLILQPLVENAIIHGRDEEGRVRLVLDVKETSKHISIMVKNNRGVSSESGGNGMAIENIRERLSVLFDDQHSFKVREDTNEYQVFVRMPKRVAPLIEE